MAVPDKNEPTQSAGGPARKPAAQGDNPNDRHDSPGVTPAALEPTDHEVPPVPGTDPDSVLRAAKHQLAATDTSGDEHAERQVERSAKARKLVAERNSAGPDRVKAIDAELKGLGFEAPLSTTESQRGGGPAGRRSPNPTTT